MTVSSWRNAALAALLLPNDAPLLANGQRIVLVPHSSSSSSSSSSFHPILQSPSPFLLSAMMSPETVGASSGMMEPPCRRRRLEPWRREVRDKCLSEATEHCLLPHDREEEDEQQQQQQQRELLFATATNRGDGRGSSISDPDHQDDQGVSSSSLVAPPPPPMMMALFREADSMMEAMLSDFLRRPDSSSEDEEEEKEDASSFDALFESTLGFSLRAFDKAVTAASNAQASSEKEEEETESNFLRPPPEGGAAVPQVVMEEGYGEEEEEAQDDVEEEEAEGGGWWTGEDTLGYEPSGEDYVDDDVSIIRWPQDKVMVNSEDDGWQREETAVFEDELEMSTPERVERVAEEALDAVVASMASRGLPPDVLERLFARGEERLAEIMSEDGAKGGRRLSEEGKEASGTPPLRARAEERIARRLTEYRADLVRGPDGTVTLYTRSYGPPNPSLFATSSSPHPPTPYYSSDTDVVASLPWGGYYVPPLGMGSTEVDDCLRSRYLNGDLHEEGGCRRAVTELLLAVDNNNNGGFSLQPPPQDNRFLIIGQLEDEATRRDAEEEVTMAFLHTGGRRCGGVAPLAFLFGALLVLAVVMIEWCFSDYEEEEGDEDDAEGFDYAELPEDDGEGPAAAAAVGEGAAPRAFVGVPVQVV